LDRQRGTTQHDLPRLSNPPSDTFSRAVPRPSSVIQSDVETHVKLPLEDLERKTDMLLEEYLSCADVLEAITCVRELNAPEYHSNIVSQSVIKCLEKKDNDRELISKLFSAFHKDKLFLTDTFVKGFHSVLEVIEDLAIDIPQAPMFVGAFVASAILDGLIPLSFLDSALNHLVDSIGKDTQAADIVCEIFCAISEASSDAHFRELFAKSKLDFSKFFPVDKRTEENLVKFLDQKNLAALFPVLTFGKQLGEMIKFGEDSSSLLRWLEETVTPDIVEDASFCRNTVNSLLIRVMSYTHALPREELNTVERRLWQEYTPLLRKLLDNTELQLQCLFEIQLFCSQIDTPIGTIQRLFKYCFEFNTISREAFLLWVEDVADKTPGKSDALAQTRKWLEELQLMANEQDSL